MSSEELRIPLLILLVSVGCGGTPAETKPADTPPPAQQQAAKVEEKPQAKEEAAPVMSPDAKDLKLVREEDHGLAGMYSGSMNVADFDGDGLLDLVFAGNFDTMFDHGVHSEDKMKNLRDRIRIYKNVSKKGAEIKFKLQEERKDFFGIRGSIVAVGDFDGNKRKDFAVQTRNGDDITAFINKGKFKFEKVILQKGLANNTTSLGMAAGDIDGDGKDDLAFISDGGVPKAGLWYRFDPKKKKWEARQTDFQHAMSNGGAIAIGDLDGDKFPEIAVSGNSSVAFGKIKCANYMIGQAHKNKGKSAGFDPMPMSIHGNFGMRQPSTARDRMDSCEGMDNGGLAIADLDLDGHNDVIIAGSATGFAGPPGSAGQQYDFAVLLNKDGTGKNFVAWENTGPPNLNGDSNGGVGNVDLPNIAVGDLNGDKYPEVFVQGHRRDWFVGGNPYVYDNMLFISNRGESFSLYDLDPFLPKFEDGLSETLQFLTRRPKYLGEGGQAIADFNNDGKNDLVFCGAELPFHTNGVNNRDENTTSTIKTYVLRNATE